MLFTGVHNYWIVDICKYLYKRALMVYCTIVEEAEAVSATVDARIMSDRVPAAAGCILAGRINGGVETAHMTTTVCDYM